MRFYWLNEWRRPLDLIDVSLIRLDVFKACYWEASIVLLGFGIQVKVRW